MKKIIFLLVFVLCLCSCKSTKVENDNTQFVFGKLESTVENMENRSRLEKEYLLEIKKNAEKIDDDLDKLEYLFSEYEKMMNLIIEDKDDEIANLKFILENR